MKRVIVCILLVVLILCLNLNSYSDGFKIPNYGKIVYNNEGYKYEEYLFFPWGTKNGEVIYGQEGEYHYYDPFFAIDNSGNIYIADYYKIRLIKITKEKKIFYIDNIGSIIGILNNGDIISGRRKVYDKNGKFKYRVDLPKEGGVLFQDINDNIYYKDASNSQIQKIEILDKETYNNYRKIKYIAKKFVVKYISNSSAHYNIEISERITIFGKTTSIKYKKFVPDLIPKDGKIADINLIGLDAEENIYCIIYLENYRKENGIKYFNGIYKFNQDGKLLLFIIPFKHNNTQKHFIDFVTKDIFRVDRYGNIYQIHISDKGVHIEKWGKGK